MAPRALPGAPVASEQRQRLRPRAKRGDDAEPCGAALVPASHHRFLASERLKLLTVEASHGKQCCTIGTKVWWT